MHEALEEHWDDFRRSLKRKGRSDATEQVYRKSWVAFWNWALPHDVEPNPAAVDHTVLNRWSDDMLATPATRNGKPITKPDRATGEQVPQMLSASTRRIRFCNLGPFFAWYAKEYEVANPFDRADSPPEVEAVVPIVEMDDLRQLLAICEGRDFTDRRDNAIIRVLIDTGARLGELLALTVDDWDRRNDYITLRGKTGTRVVPVSPSTGQALARYLRVRNAHQKAKLTVMWLAPRGALGESGVAQLLERRCETAKISKINPHKLRHTWAHEFRNQGGSEGDMLYLAGWRSPAMAHRYGRSAAASRARDAARRINIGDKL